MASFTALYPESNKVNKLKSKIHSKKNLTTSPQSNF